MEKTVFVDSPAETRGGWREIDAPRLPAECGNSPVRAYKKGSCRVLLGHEDRHGTGRKRWHLSISHPARYPNWEEIKDARYALLPHGITAAMILPPPEEYVNVHPNCFHLWEIDDE